MVPRRPFHGRRVPIPRSSVFLEEMGPGALSLRLWAVQSVGAYVWIMSLPPVRPEEPHGPLTWFAAMILAVLGGGLITLIAMIVLVAFDF